MLRLEFTKQEVDEIKSKIYLSELQERIFEYRLKEYSITKMAMLENVSESTINRELKKIKNKIMKILWHFLDIKLEGSRQFYFFFLLYNLINSKKIAVRKEIHT